MQNVIRIQILYNGFVVSWNHDFPAFQFDIAYSFCDLMEINLDTNPRLELHPRVRMAHT
jgi:hypothetical protein